MSYKNTARAVEVDQRAEQSLMCKAHSCPLRWSVQTGEVTACSHHAWADMQQWPRITDEIRRGVAGYRRDGESVTVADMKKRVRGSIGNAAQKVAA